MDNPPDPGKPRLVFFQWDHQPNMKGAKYLSLQMQHHVKCLAETFDVKVVNEDCDYAEICDRYEPDLALFESGYRSHGSRAISIRNVNAHPKVARIGLHNGDAWCDRRAGFLSDMDAWGIETYFTIATAMPEYTPAVADRTFLWPNFIDPALFRDYGQQKSVPVMLTGQVYGLYPWRQDIYKILSDTYPCLVSPAFGYDGRSAARALSGERYARAMNASFMVPSCGTMGRELVRKHFEIPGARSCLLTENTPILKTAGFVDMENCVFVDKSDVIDRVDYLFDHLDVLERITDAGHALVHTRHTYRQRRQIRDWYELNRTLKPGERIDQPDPFGPLVVVPNGQHSLRPSVAGNGKDRALLIRGDRYLQEGDIGAARKIFSECLRYVSYLPEARVRLALCSLYEGKAAEAVSELAALIEISTIQYKGSVAAKMDPDPVEWSLFLVALVCKGRVSEARQLLGTYPRLSHGEIDRIAEMIGRLDGSVIQKHRKVPSGNVRRSIHAISQRTDKEWLNWAADLLRRCGQTALASRLGAGVAQGPVETRQAWKVLDGVALWRRGLDGFVRWLGIDGLHPSVPPTRDFHYMDRLSRNAARRVLPAFVLDLPRKLSDGKRAIPGQLKRHPAVAKSKND